MADRFPDGVWLVELAPVRDRDAVARTFVLALGLRPLPGLSPAEAAALLTYERDLTLLHALGDG